MAARRPFAIVTLLALAVALLWLHYRNGREPAFTCGEHCGTERWRIKTLSDSDARNIDWNPRHASISQLTELKAPSFLGDERSEEEEKVYSIEGVLLGWKTESLEHGDRDFHLVLGDPADPNRTIIAEIPSEECEGACSSGHASQFATARETLMAELGAPEAHFRRVRPAWIVRVQGVAFFDVYHRQIGVAENCIELHPVTKVEFIAEFGPTAMLPRRIEPPQDPRCGRL